MLFKNFHPYLALGVAMLIWQSAAIASEATLNLVCAVKNPCANQSDLDYCVDRVLLTQTSQGDVKMVLNRSQGTSFQGGIPDRVFSPATMTDFAYSATAITADWGDEDTVVVLESDDNGSTYTGEGEASDFVAGLFLDEDFTFALTCYNHNAPQSGDDSLQKHVLQHIYDIKQQPLYNMNNVDETSSYGIVVERFDINTLKCSAVGGFYVSDTALGTCTINGDLNGPNSSSGFAIIVGATELDEAKAPSYRLLRLGSEI